jgi:hypothetical protein
MKSTIAPTDATDKKDNSHRYKVTVQYIEEVTEYVYAENDTDAKFQALKKYPSFISAKSEKEA